MKFILNHGVKIVTFVVVAVCAYSIWSGLQWTKDPAFDKLDTDTKKIKEKLANNRVDEKWPWSSSNQVDYSARLVQAIGRPAQPLNPLPETSLVYPRPQRPYVDKDLEPVSVVGYVSKPAVLKPPTEFTVKADHNGMYLASRLVEQPFFIPVRVEFYRADKPEGPSLKIGEAVLNPEEFVEAGAAGPAAAPLEKKEKPEAEGYGETTLAKRLEAPPAAGGKPAKEPAVLPDEYKDLIVFPDRNVLPKKEVMYKLRLVAKLVPMEPNNLIRSKVAGQKDTRVLIPDELLARAVKPAKDGSGVRLFASAFTEPVKAISPPNFIFRFQGHIFDGVTKALPDPAALQREAPDYKGVFAVRVWVPQIRDWREDTVRVPVGKELEGSVRYKPPEAKGRDEVYEFKTGYQLMHIVEKAEREMVERSVPVTKKVLNPETGVEEDEPQMDPKSGRPMMKKIQVEVEHPSELATLKDLESGKLEEHFIRKDFEKRKETFLVLDRIFKEQEERDKKEKERIRNLIRKPVEPGNPMGTHMPPHPQGPGGPGGPSTADQEKAYTREGLQRE